ncbi:MAG: transposase, partial [Lachnospiraceae bacterium]|nr:transposase [Lachnospiraceae bacterium]
MSKDAAENRLEDWDDVFVDIFNNLVFGGHEIIKEEDLIPLPTRSYTRKMDGRLRSGILYIRKWSRKSGVLRLVSAIENQTEIDNTMPERV